MQFTTNLDTTSTHCRPTTAATQTKRARCQTAAIRKKEIWSRSSLAYKKERLSHVNSDVTCGKKENCVD